MEFSIENNLARSEETSELAEESVAVPFDLGPDTEVPHIDIPPAQSKVIAIASGKGGTGKTTFTTNLAISLRRRELRVLLVDADFGLANDHLLLGVEPHGDIGDVLAGRKAIRDVILTGPAGIHLLPGGMGSSHLSNLENYDMRVIAREIGQLEPDYDIILLDLAAGVSSQIINFLKPAHEAVLVTNPEVTALIDAYGLIKCLHQEDPEGKQEIHVVFNRVRDREESLLSMQKLRHTVGKHLQQVRLNYLGFIPFDRYLLHSISIQKPAVLSHPRAFVTACLKGIEEKIFERFKIWEKNQNLQTPCPSYFALLEKQSYM